MNENGLKRDKLAAIPASETGRSVNDFFRLLSKASRVRFQSPLKMASRPTSKERPEKILVAMYKLAHGGTKPLKYEDIVVKAFEMFPEEFALRGYPQYPDSSDLHKPLYGPLKRQGLVRSANKMFALTPRGAEVGKKLVEAAGSSLEEAMGDARRITRTQQAEVERMLSSAAHELFSKGESGKILDTDFYRFIGCTVRTPRNEFLGRMTATEGAVKAAKKLGFPNPEGARALHDEWEFMTKQFKTLIDRQKGDKDGSGKPQNNPAEE
jgi:hypothetical protein